MINEYKKPTKKEERNKEAIFQNRSLLFLFSSFFVIKTHKFVCRCLWVVKTKKDEKRKRRERFWKVSFFFAFTTHKHLHKHLWVVKTKKEPKKKKKEK